MKQKSNQTLFSYWNDVRGDRMAPKRFEIEPSQIAGILADTFILECVDPATIRFRLAGTRICEQFQREFRGANLYEFFDASDHTTLTRTLACAQMQAPALVLTFDAITKDGRSTPFEMILLPLMHTQDTVSRFLGGLSALEPPLWLGYEPLVRQHLTAHKMIWPDGRPFSLMKSVNRQTPFPPQHKLSRVVTAERRRFRVYAGGRAGEAPGARPGMEKTKPSV